ncbi:MAG: hypothetical protein WBA05_02455 [Gordonia sp. (in: high G+C Gram-positive bacteria)]|uniref:hypothetical protein n=1 Tax=Gordonia sp. (in: high G+C Gram-positive bacteria) TaxID=84139 RepID=UPI003C77566C
MEQHIELSVSVYRGDTDITAGPATLSVVDDGPVEIEIPVDLGALGWLSIRFR